MTTSYRQGRVPPTTTLVTYNHFVDNATGANKIERWSVQPGNPTGGDRVLYWAEDLEPKIKRDLKRNLKKIWGRGFFWVRLSPRASRFFFTQGPNYPRGKAK